MDDVVFTDGESDIGLFPIGAVGGWAENELAADDGLVVLGIGGRLAGFGHESETPGENLHAACLVDEVERTAFEGEFFVRRLEVARQEHYRQVHAALAQLR